MLGEESLLLRLGVRGTRSPNLKMSRAILDMSLQRHRLTEPLKKAHKYVQNRYSGAHITWLVSYVFFDTLVKRRMFQIKRSPVRTQHIVKSEEEALPEDVLSRRSFRDGFSLLS